MHKITEFIGAHGLVMEQEDMAAHVERFLQEMKLGLGPAGSSLQMIPTYVGLDGEPDYSKKVIVIDAGGTNLRVALVAFSQDGTGQVEYFEKYPMLGTREALDAGTFYRRLAGYLEPVIDKADHIGVCFSFPAEILPNRDARILYFDKEVKVMGAEGSVIGENLRAAMEELGMPGGKSVVVINDTVASLLGAKAGNQSHTEYGSYIGFILGTGLNACYVEQNSRILKNPRLAAEAGGTIINMESGGYAYMPQSDVDTAFIAATKDPGHQLMEKMSSGAYQGGLLLAYLQKAAEQELFSPGCCAGIQTLEELTGQDIDRFCDYPFGDNLLAGLCAIQEDAEAVYRIADAFFDKVAWLTAVNLSAILTALGDAARNPCKPVCISAEGTTFYKARLFRPKLDYFMMGYAHRKNGLYYRFVKAENATILGTAAAGLLGNKKER